MRIVVVEDEAPIREGMAKLLSKINPEYELAGKAAARSTHDCTAWSHPFIIQIPRIISADNRDLLLPL